MLFVTSELVAWPKDPDDPFGGSSGAGPGLLSREQLLGTTGGPEALARFEARDDVLFERALSEETEEDKARDAEFESLPRPEQWERTLEEWTPRLGSREAAIRQLGTLEDWMSGVRCVRCGHLHAGGP